MSFFCIIKTKPPQNLRWSDCRKRTHRKVNTKKFKLISKEYYIITNELFYLCSFCHKCQKPIFYTLCLLRHRSLPYFCTACFALPRLRPFSFVFSACRLYRHAEGVANRNTLFFALSLGLVTRSSTPAPSSN